MVNFHLPIPEPLHTELRATANAQGRPATELARDLVREGLARLHRAQRQEELRTFAEAMAGSELDLDPLMEAAGLEAISEGAGKAR